MTNVSIQPLWLTYFIEILLVLEFQLTKTYFGTFSYKAHFRPQISSNGSGVIPIMRKQLYKCKKGRRKKIGYFSILVAFFFERVSGLSPTVPLRVRSPHHP